MLDKKYYWPMISKYAKGKLEPRGYIPSKFMYAEKEGTDAYNSAAKGNQYWLSWDSALCLRQNKEYLANLFSYYTLIELGGFDGSALNDIFKSGAKKKIAFQYINVDLGDSVLLLMKKNFKDIPNVKYSLVNFDFDDIKFLKSLRTAKPKAILFLQNTFGNYTAKQGDIWLKQLYLSMGNEDVFILGFDRRVSAKAHLECYNIPENGHMTMLAAKYLKYPIDHLRGCTYFDKEGIHGGVLVVKEFIFKGKIFKRNDFIEVFVSRKPTLKEMTSRVKKAGFSIVKILKSDKKHIYHLVLKKK